MGHVMRKPIYAICEQQRRRSACASEISSLYLASVAAKGSLSLPRSQNPKTGFLVTRLIIGPGHAKTCLIPYANNKGADQSVVRCLDSTICILAISKVSRF